MTTGDMENERLDELIALAAMGELSIAETEELDRLLDTSVDAAAELAESLDVAAELQQQHRAAPPEQLRAAVLDAIASTPQDDPADTRSDGPETAAHSPTPNADESGQTSDAFARPTSLDTARRRRWAPMLAAAAAILVVVGGAVAVVWPSNEVDEVAAVLDATDATLRPLDGRLDGELTVVHSASESAIALDGEGLDPVPDDRTLQLWLIDDDGTAVSAGLFRPDDDGGVRLRVDGVDPTGVTLGLTEEPSGGSDRPSVPILATG